MKEASSGTKSQFSLVLKDEIVLIPHIVEIPIASQPEDLEINLEEQWSWKSIGFILKEKVEHYMKKDKCRMNT